MMSQIFTADFVSRIVETGVIAACFIFCLYWILNRFSSDIRAQAKITAINTIALTALSKQLLRHDAQVRGINPTIGDDDNGRESEAYREYETLHGILDSMAVQINQIAAEGAKS